MRLSDLVTELTGTYRKHGWQLRRVLLRPQSQEDLDLAESFGDEVSVQESEIDAMWFSRPSNNGREAWELRQLTETPFALFETFEKDEAEEEREDVRREMEARIRDAGC